VNGQASPNRANLVRVASQLRPLLTEMVFVGGQVAELLNTDPAAARIRPTDDVDVLVSATSRVEYRTIERKLAALGLQNDLSEDAPICRWLTPDGLRVDVMPVDQEILGFSNQWYSAAAARAVEYRLTNELTVKIPTAPLYLAMKWDAFLGRAEGDVLGSHDLEDIISVVAGRPEMLEEMETESEELRRWLAKKAREFLDEPLSEYAIHGALPDAVALPGLISEIRSRFERIAACR